MTDLSNAIDRLNELEIELKTLQVHAADMTVIDPFMVALTVFVLSCFIGYYVVWRVTPALHTPLMSVTNAISGIIVVGAMIALGPIAGDHFSRGLGFFAVLIASINIFGGFVVTQRMLEMYRKKEKK